jgi:hypothetical protein
MVITRPAHQALGTHRLRGATRDVSAHQTTGSIANDFQLTLNVIVDADVSIGVASVLTEVFQP